MPHNSEQNAAFLGWAFIPRKQQGIAYYKSSALSIFRLMNQGIRARDHCCGTATNSLKRGVKPADKPGSVVGSHSSGPAITVRLKPPTRELGGSRQRSPIWCCSGWRLPRFTPDTCAPGLVSVALFLAFAESLRLRLIADGRYPSPYPVEPGLSSARSSDD